MLISTGCKNDTLACRSLSRGYCRTYAGLFPGWKKPNKKVVHQEEGGKEEEDEEREANDIFAVAQS